jgi:NADH-quinone oxidoreductase subunit L
VVTAPLLLLAFPSVVIGFLTIEPMLFGDLLKDAIAIDRDKHPAMAVLAHEFHGPVEMALHGLTTAPFWLALAGVAAAWYMYLRNPALPAAIQRRLQPLYTLLENKYYMDWFNENVIARGARLLGEGLWKGGDRAVIDGALVNGSARGVAWVAGVVRWFQTGYIYHYAFAMIVGVFALMTWFVWLQR